MSEGGKTACDSCEYRGIATLAIKYCRSCQENLCKDCIAFHRSFKLTRGHLLVDSEEKQTLQLCSEIDNLRMCKQHSNKAIEFYCLAHESLLCSFCIIKSGKHRECNRNIVDIESVGKSLIKCHFPSTVKCNLQKSISRAKDAVQSMTKITNESSVQTERLKLSVEQLRSKLITSFDKKTKKVLAKAQKRSKDINERYTTKIEKIEDIIKAAEAHKILLESEVESGLPEDVFRCSIRMLELIDDFNTETEVGNGEEGFKRETFSLKSDLLEFLEKYDKPLVQFEVKETIIKPSTFGPNELSYEMMKKQFLSLCALEDKQSNTKDQTTEEALEHKDIGTKTNNKDETLKAVNKSSDEIETCKNTHIGRAESFINVSKTGKEHKDMKLYDVSLEHTCCYSVSASDNKVAWLSGLACLQNDSIVISDFKHSRLHLLNKYYQVVSTKNLEYEPGHISLLSEDCISICLMKTNQILLVDVQQGSLKEKKYIQTEFHPKCVQIVNDKLLVSCQNGQGEWTLNLMTSVGEVCREIKLTRFFDGHKIAIQRLNLGESRLRIIQCCEITNKLQCFEFDGTFVFEKDIANVSSVLTDSNGYIFVIRYTGEIQVLDPAGEVKWKMFRQPLVKAKFAAFNKTMDKLFITINKTSKLNVLNVKRAVVEK